MTEMTIEEVLMLPAGHTLDAQVAKLVLGKLVSEARELGFLNRVVGNKHRWLYQKLRRGRCHWRSIEPYSTDPRYSAEVVQAIRLKGQHTQREFITALKEELRNRLVLESDLILLARPRDICGAAIMAVTHAAPSRLPMAV